jgi:hypothetical protein
MDKKSISIIVSIFLYASNIKYCPEQRNTFKIISYINIKIKLGSNQCLVERGSISLQEK